MRAHPQFYDNMLYKPTYLLTYCKLTMALCPVRYLVEPRCTLFQLLSANSLSFGLVI